eukprot:7137648-Heterocapsa_arctica.AAC.1
MLKHTWPQQLGKHGTNKRCWQYITKMRHTRALNTNRPSHRGCRTGDGQTPTGGLEAHRIRSDKVNPHKENRIQGDETQLSEHHGKVHIDTRYKAKQKIKYEAERARDSGTVMKAGSIAKRKNGSYGTNKEGSEKGTGSQTQDKQYGSCRAQISQ